ncbi:hypothetical protein [uncultured Ilyobacter sp.]|uniref:hypothetical protein n=1 Tax=uncultured Ilyobacter sp. TaxID=544433 RepID=UPI0029C0DDF5|nr:hypothetical protein [uncultured Ilyobacter sp.]
MLVWGFDTDYLIGPAELSLDGISLGPTLESESVKLTISPITEEVKTDVEKEPVEIIQLDEKVTFECTVPFTSDMAEMLELSGNSLELHRTGELKIISSGLEITLYKAAVTMTLSKPYSYSELNTLKISARGLKNSSGYKYNIELTS